MQIRNTVEKLLVEDADAWGSTFRDVDLSGSTFSEANLAGAAFRDINLSRARLCDGDLSDVEISGCNIERMTIDGVLVEDLLALHKKQRSSREKKEAKRRWLLPFSFAVAGVTARLSSSLRNAA